jgi:hypothetical protein
MTAACPDWRLVVSGYPGAEAGGHCDRGYNPPMSVAEDVDHHELVERDVVANKLHAMNNPIVCCVTLAVA